MNDAGWLTDPSFSGKAFAMSRRGRRPILLRLYRLYLDNQDIGRYSRRVAARYSQGTLERLSEHPLPQVRRAAVLALGLLADYGANHAMGLALVDEDRTVRAIAQRGIRNVWARDGNPDQQERLKQIMELNAAKQYDEAIRQATALIDDAPWLAEAWNQRAVARFGLKQYAEAVRDCHQTLEINPYHFPAASGMGHAYVRLNNPLAALEAFRRALRLNPDLDSARAAIQRLSRTIGDP